MDKAMGHLRQAQGATLGGACICTASPKRVRSDDLAGFLRRSYLEIRLMGFLLHISGLSNPDSKAIV